ncbi:PucR family transcriptional regulator [Streptomyces alboflavus]|uniref:PucR family transcriptional regulator n=1 Tax=Streptomyces alboflavus TaxID=67267 RepID=UPI0004BF2205|nr:PucR family transcriptional regulator [Streptomyces alboflavus]
MLTLGMLAGRAELELAFAGGVDAARFEAVGVAGLTALTVSQLLEGEPQRRLDAGCLVLVTGLQFRGRGRAEVALETLMEQLALDGCAGLVVSLAPGAHQPLPQAIRDLSHALSVPVLVTTAPLREWAKTRHRLQESRLAGAELRASQLTTLVQQVPSELADPRAMQRIADWLARALQVQVLVSDPHRVLAASPATAAEALAPAIIHSSVDAAASSRPSGPHTRLISLGPARGAGTVLAVARGTAPFDDAEVRLLGHAAKLLGLLDQARREYRAAAETSRAARRAAVELLLDGEVDKARRVLAAQAPGLLDADTVRVFVVDVPCAHRDVAVRRCEVVTEGRALVIADPRADRRIVVVQPVRPGRPDDGVGADLTRLVAALGAEASVGGSGVYSMSLLADALREASAAQGFALLQPDAAALSAPNTDLIGLLPPRDAQLWARTLLDPLMRHDAQWEQMRETLSMALAHPYTVAARRLNLHRNTVTRRVARAAEALRVDFTSVADRIAVGLALELVTHREPPARSMTPGTPGTPDAYAPTLHSLLSSPQITAWADTLLRSARGDRRDLITTATVWLTHEAHLEPAARALGLSEATVRSHLRALEAHMSRDLGSLGGLRDLQFALYVATGKVEIAESRGVLVPAT